MKKTIIPFFLLANIAILIVGNTLSAQDTMAAAQNNESDKKGVGFQSRLLDFNEIQNGNDEFLKIDNWDVDLNSSSAYISNIKRSYVKQAVNKNNSRFFLGVRGNFPKIDANSYITVKPRYDISFYTKDSLPITEPNKKGVVPNVGVIREVRVRIGGRNYKHKFFLNMIKSTGEKLNIDFGSLFFSGWKELVWKNPHFLDDHRHQKSELTPLYPRIVSALKFQNFIIFRERTNTRPGDFIAYVDYIDVFYNKASAHEDFPESPEDFIDDEGTWNIIKNEVAGPKTILLQQKLSEFRCLERIEKLKRNIPLTEEEKGFNPCFSEDSNSNTENINAAEGFEPTANPEPAPILDQEEDALDLQAPAAGENQ